MLVLAPVRQIPFPHRNPVRSCPFRRSPGRPRNRHAKKTTMNARVNVKEAKSHMAKLPGAAIIAAAEGDQETARGAAGSNRLDTVP